MTRRRAPWWVEFPLILITYECSEWVRGRAKGSPADAAHHAKQVIAIERFFGFFREAAIQRPFLGNHAFIQFWDIYYGTVHFIVPVVALIWLWRRFPERYRRWRNALVGTVLISLFCFKFYPLLPPRLLPAHYHFVDTAARIGGMGVFDKGSMKDVENLYAAMPSLHIAWSTWCALALVPVVRRRWLQVVLLAYPFCTLFAVVVTANHYILDGVGGWVVLAGGYALALLWESLDPVTTVRSKIQLGDEIADEKRPCLTPTTGSATTTSPASRR